jgi:hypothetical protein
VATIGRTFEFTIIGVSERGAQKFDLLLTDTGWILGNLANGTSYDPYGPSDLAIPNNDRISLSDETKTALAALHSNHSVYSDRAFQQRMTVIAESVSPKHQRIRS